MVPKISSYVIHCGDETYKMSKDKDPRQDLQQVDSFCPFYHSLLSRLKVTSKEYFVFC